MGVSEYTTMDWARTYDDNNNIYPYEEVGPGVTQTFTKKLTNTVTVDLSIGVTAFGVTLKIQQGVTAGGGKKEKPKPTEFEKNPKKRCFLFPKCREINSLF